MPGFLCIAGIHTCARVFCVDQTNRFESRVRALLAWTSPSQCASVILCLVATDSPYKNGKIRVLTLFVNFDLVHVHVHSKGVTMEGTGPGPGWWAWMGVRTTICNP